MNYSKFSRPTRALKTGQVVRWKGRRKAGIMLMEYL